MTGCELFSQIVCSLSWIGPVWYKPLLYLSSTKPFHLAAVTKLVEAEVAAIGAYGAGIKGPPSFAVHNVQRLIGLKTMCNGSSHYEGADEGDHYARTFGVRPGPRMFWLPNV